MTTPTLTVPQAQMLLDLLTLPQVQVPLNMAQLALDTKAALEAIVAPPGLPPAE